MQQILSGLSQNELAEKSGIAWGAVSRLVALNIIKPVARVGDRFVFSPDAVDKIQAHLSQAKAADEEKYRSQFDAAAKAEFGTFAAFVAYQKNSGGISEHTRPGKNKPTVIKTRVGGAA